MVSQEVLSDIISMLSLSQKPLSSFDQHGMHCDAPESQRNSASPSTHVQAEGLASRSNFRSQSTTGVEQLLPYSNIELGPGRNWRAWTDSPQNKELEDRLGSVVPAVMASRMHEEREKLTADRSRGGVDEDDEEDENDGSAAVSDGELGPQAVQSGRNEADDEWPGLSHIASVARPFRYSDPQHTSMQLFGSDSAEQSGHNSPLTLAPPNHLPLPRSSMHNEPPRLWQNESTAGSVGDPQPPDRPWTSLPRSQGSQMQSELRSQSWSALNNAVEPCNVRRRQGAGEGASRHAGKHDSTDLDLTVIRIDQTQLPQIDDDA